jgi:hypothetical protein
MLNCLPAAGTLMRRGDVDGRQGDVNHRPHPGQDRGRRSAGQAQQPVDQLLAEPADSIGPPGLPQLRQRAQDFGRPGLLSRPPGQAVGGPLPRRVAVLSGVPVGQSVVVVPDLPAAGALPRDQLVRDTRDFHHRPQALGDLPRLPRQPQALGDLFGQQQRVQRARRHHMLEQPPRVEVPVGPHSGYPVPTC